MGECMEVVWESDVWAREAEGSVAAQHGPLSLCLT